MIDFIVIQREEQHYVCFFFSNKERGVARTHLFFHAFIISFDFGAICM